ncbi:amino acid deaminase [Rhodococcus sp. ABRD24]|uniref:alanine racemase n=1 Tax=Rhodococcus sp. ABRD24 TaxID=2507582 RepID=UPI00103EAF29|nr:alanine racemase [Rhodococcus sp. ABRD24]QBJ95878.1 amino acid deaminase [Rhodococcus sp. ABRD24]
MNRERLAALDAYVIDSTVKGFPVLPGGTTVQDFSAGGPSLFDAGFLPPIMVLRDSALRTNISTMADFCRRHGVLFAPHGKTMMAPQLVQRQLDAGAWAVTVATPSQARMYRSFGASRILLANELVDPAAVAWLMTEMDADPGFEFLCYVDSVAGVELLAGALDTIPGSNQLQVLIEVGAPGGRTGNRTSTGVMAVANRAAEIPRLKVRGVSGFEGVLAHHADEASLEVIRGYLRELRSVAEAVRQVLGPVDDPNPVEPFLVSAGGSAYFDLVADELTRGWDSDQVQVVVRSGAYLTHDSEYFAELSPFSRSPLNEPEQPGLTAAIEIWGSVLSIPEPGLALVGAGKRDVPYDIHLPLAEAVRRRDGSTVDLRGIVVEEVNDQHAYLRGDVRGQLEVGDWVRFGISHPCTAFDKWKLIPVVDDDHRVIDCVQTFF